MIASKEYHAAYRRRYGKSPKGRLIRLRANRMCKLRATMKVVERHRAKIEEVEAELRAMGWKPRKRTPEVGRGREG